MESSPDPRPRSSTASEAERPLLIETVPGEPGDSFAAGIGRALVFLGGVAILAYILLSVLAGPSLTGEWEGVWYRPGPQVDFVPVIALLVMFAGLALYIVGRCRGGGGASRR
jgi:hypothetical protein